MSKLPKTAVGYAKDQRVRRLAPWLTVWALFGCEGFTEGTGVGGESTTANGSTSSVSSTTTDDETRGVASEIGTTDEVTTALTSSSSGDPQTTSSSGEARPRCGNGAVDEGEDCDDGNRSDFDACTSECLRPRCDDGTQNGNETDVDCGGDCRTMCEAGNACRDRSDCDTGVCDRTGRCAEPTCFDGVANQGELTPDCGAVCDTPPVNRIVNGGFEDGESAWVTENPEVGPQSAYFDDGSSNRVMEIDRSGSQTSTWRQMFSIPGHRVGEELSLTLDVGDREDEPNDFGGLLIRIVDPDSNPLTLTGVSGAGFINSGTTEIGIDAQQVSSFSTAVITFVPPRGGDYLLEFLEQTRGGTELDDGGGIIIDNIEVLVVECPG